LKNVLTHFVPCELFFNNPRLRLGMAVNLFYTSVFGVRCSVFGVGVGVSQL